MVVLELGGFFEFWPVAFSAVELWRSGFDGDLFLKIWFHWRVSYACRPMAEILELDVSRAPGAACASVLGRVLVAI